MPKKVEKNLVIPILKKEKINKDTDIWEYSETLSKRARRNIKVDDITIEYLLRVAIPTYTSSPPKIAYMKVQANGQTANSEFVEDIEAIAQRTFEEHQGGILLKTIARALLKYIAFKSAEKKGKVAGFLVNLVNVATEKADTRSWLTLPNNIQMARLSLPAGVYDLKLTFYDQFDRVVTNADIPGMTIPENDYTFLNYRTFH